MKLKLKPLTTTHPRQQSCAVLAVTVVGDRESEVDRLAGRAVSRVSALPSEQGPPLFDAAGHQEGQQDREGSKEEGHSNKQLVLGGQATENTVMSHHTLQ